MQPHTTTLERQPMDPARRHALVADLARAHGRRVFHAAYAVLGDSALAEDVQQTVFLRLLERPPGDVDSWPAYLSTAATRAAIDELRKRGRWARLTPAWLEALVSPGGRPEAVAGEAGRARRLREALGRIRPLEATCFSLRYFQSMEIGDIARTLALTENHVSVTLHRAVKSLKALVQESPNESQETTR